MVDGWPSEDSDALHNALAAKLATLEAPAENLSLRGETVQPAGPSSPPAAALADGIGDWEVDPARLQFLEKVAAGSFGDLFRGMYNGQEVAIKVLRLAHHTDEAHLVREFMQELAGV